MARPQFSTERSPKWFQCTGERAFAIFYTGILGSSALAPVLFGRLGDATGPVKATIATALTALLVVPLMMFLSPRLVKKPPV